MTTTKLVNLLTVLLYTSRQDDNEVLEALVNKYSPLQVIAAVQRDPRHPKL